MSKAFTREESGAADADDEDDAPGLPPLPPGTRNYITPQGYRRLREELMSLLDVERPKVVETVSWAAKNGDRSENGDYLYGKKRLREIDRRIRFLTKRLEIAEIVDPSVHTGSDQVYFGATVTCEFADGRQVTVTIMGIDEADSRQQQITWVSPLARTLLRSKVGDEVMLHTPTGLQPVEVLDVRYG